MIRSMTGFGQAAATVQGYKVSMELKSVNHRYLEVQFRMPREWLVFEEPLKKLVRRRVKRGRVEVFIHTEKDADRRPSPVIDWALAEAYVEAAVQLKERFGLADSVGVRDLLQLPELLRFEEPEADADALLDGLSGCIEDALSRLVQMREAEGASLAADMDARIGSLERERRLVEAGAPKVAAEYRTKLEARLEELLGDSSAVDPDRLLMEAAIVAERADIMEELIRLDSHFKQCRQLLHTDEPVGRKLDFLIQEMNREVNTIGSKSASADLAGRVVEMKAELEKLREQVQNIE